MYFEIHLDTHQTLRFRACARIPLLKVTFPTLAGSHASEIKIYHSIATTVFPLIFSRKLGKENKLLGCSVADGGERPGAHADAKAERFPDTRQRGQLSIRRT